MKKIFSVLLVGVMMIIQGCDESTEPLECPEDLGCTEEFVTFTYAPKDNSGNAIILDTYYSQNLDNGMTYGFNNPISPGNEGVYGVISDAQMSQVKASGTVIRFVGLIDDEIVIEQDFLIGHNCCHIVALEGPGVE